MYNQVEVEVKQCFYVGECFASISWRLYVRLLCMLCVCMFYKISNFSVLLNILNSAKVDAVEKTCSALHRTIKEDERNKEQALQSTDPVLVVIKAPSLRYAGTLKGSTQLMNQRKHNIWKVQLRCEQRNYQTHHNLYLNNKIYWQHMAYTLY